MRQSQLLNHVLPVLLLTNHDARVGVLDYLLLRLPVTD